MIDGSHCNIFSSVAPSCGKRRGHQYGTSKTYNRFNCPEDSTGLQLILFFDCHKGQEPPSQYSTVEAVAGWARIYKYRGVIKAVFELTILVLGN